MKYSNMACRPITIEECIQAKETGELVLCHHFGDGWGNNISDVKIVWVKTRKPRKLQDGTFVLESQDILVQFEDGTKVLYPMDRLEKYYSAPKYSKPTNDKNKDMFYIAGTGSRELILDIDKRRKVRDYLADLLVKAKEKHGDKLIIISGMAEGFDEAFARAAIMTNVPFIAAIPNEGYLNYYWGNNSMLKRNRMKEADWILDHAAEFTYVCKGIYGPDGRHANHHRNEWMVDRANIVWAYNPQTKGTAQCVSYAKKTGKNIFVVDPDNKYLG